MSDVFISYARASAETAHRMAEALRAAGYQVWRDDQLPAHRPYAEVIEQRLRGARAVVVAWSVEALKSHWVRAEADVGRLAGTLVQGTLDGAEPPLPFNQIQVADLRGWTGEAAHPGWQKVLASVADLVDPQAASAGAARGSAPGPAGRLLAVMAFDNLGADEELTYFSDGVSEEILQTVSAIPDLKVLGRSSSFQFRGAAKSIARVRAELAATHVLDGSVRRSGGQVRISASLVECMGQTTLWSGRFDGDLSDIFALQDRIARGVAEALQVALAPAAAPRRIAADAHDLYLRARSLAGAPPTNRECMRLLEEAVALAPDFAPAWASLAISRAVDLRWQAAPDDAAVRRAGVLEAARRAEALDPSLGLSFVALSELEPAAAYSAREALIGQALAASPHDAEVFKHAADFAVSVGRMREGFRFLSKAYGIDPLNQVVAHGHALSLADIGLVEEAYDAFEEARTRWPDFSWLTASPLLVSSARGDWAVAEPLMENARRLGNAELQRVLALVNAIRDPADPARGNLLAQTRAALEKTGRVELWALGNLCNVGLQDEAYDLVARASFDHAFAEVYGRASQVYTPVIFAPTTLRLRRDPRFVDLCAKLGLCRYWAETQKWPDFAQDPDLGYDLAARVRATVAAGA